MYISCNCLKKYIKNSDKIDFEKLWNDFTIKSAEIDNIIIKGKDISKVVVALVKNITTHKDNDKYKIATLDIGNNKEIIVVTSATNIYEGMIVPCALEGGSLKGLASVKTTEVSGVMSEGVLASEKELGISDSHLGIMDLDKTYKIGENIKKYIPIDDVIIEIDNKSLTNRPDMWGHLGIARELKAVCGLELVDLKVENINNDKDKNISVVVEDQINCNRYSAISIENISKKEADLNTRVMLYYCNMRSISLIVDLTNYLMLELGQPLHAFDASNINEIVVKNTGKEKIKFTTLDGENRDIPENTLMIYNKNTPLAIAGIMGGKDAEVTDETKNIILESANFDASCIRKSANVLGLRTEAVVRYEKKIDPEMTSLAIKRFIYLLKQVDIGIKVTSNMTDIYVNKIEQVEIILKKDYLKKYMGFDMQAQEVIKILESLDFKAEESKDVYKVCPPSYRTTKDVVEPADVIEEIARIYGYNNLKAEPLKLDLVINHGDGIYQTEYNIKKMIAQKIKANEVHTYLWYQTDMLNKLNIDKTKNLTVINKKDNNILRDDLNLSLMSVCFENSKHTLEFDIFEIASVINNGFEERHLAVMAESLDSNIEAKYKKIKQLVFDIVKINKNIEVEFVKGSLDKEYLDNEYTLIILVDKKEIGYISLVKKSVSSLCSKKVSIVTLNLNMDKFLDIDEKEVLYKEISKYPNTILDYTIITNIETPYITLDNMLKNISNKNIKKYLLKDIYEDEKKKTTIRFSVGSNHKTLTGEDLDIVKKEIEKHIIAQGFDFVGR